MKEPGANPRTPVTAVRPQRSLRWLDSLAWLAIAGALTALLVPAKSEQTASKCSGGENDSVATTASQNNQPSPLSSRDDSTSFPSGHEFILQNEADFLSSQNAPPVPPGAQVGRRPNPQPVESGQDDSPRVTAGPTLNGPQLGSPSPR